MIIYSPKSQNPDVFKKNTIKNQVTYNRKIATAGSVIEFERITEKERKTKTFSPKRKDTFGRFFNFLKDRFYERMKVFFDFEDKYREKARTFDFADE
ncbi:MAG: hypothetical protein V1904_05815 [Bacteroidota bacterium]